MSDPYEVMGLAAGAGETEIRQRYLELVREFPPTAHRSVSPRCTRPTQVCATRLSASMPSSFRSTRAATRSRRSQPFCVPGCATRGCPSMSCSRWQNHHEPSV